MTGERLFGLRISGFFRVRPSGFGFLHQRSLQNLKHLFHASFGASSAFGAGAAGRSGWGGAGSGW